MTRKLEDLLNLPSAEPDDKVEQPAPAVEERPVQIPTKAALAEIDKVTAALPTVSGLSDASDAELDDLAHRAVDAYDELMSLGMNVEARYSARIFEVASGMLKNAIDARTAKLNKKLKIVELQLKQQKLELEKSAGKNSESEPIVGEGTIVTDRNTLMEKLRNMK